MSEVSNKYQKFFVGQKVVFSFPREPALKDVSNDRLNSKGIISKVFLRRGKLTYVVTLDHEVLSSREWQNDGSYLK
jgi:hypothetical protein